MNDTQVYTAGIFAKKAGVTLKTIHHYDKAGLLKPSGYSDAGYRLYTDLDFGRLQKILTLKFLGFSLEDIKELVTADSNDSNLNQSLTIQKNIIDEKIKHLSLVRRAIDQTLSMKETHAPHYWDHFINIIDVVNSEKICLDQYKNSANLSARIHLHDAYSTNTDGWHNWFFDQLKLTDNLKILELGCGKASLWQRNVDKIPKNCEIILSDLSEGMLVEAKYTLADYAGIFDFEVMDIQNIKHTNETFDVVIADHMLYHVPNRQKAFSEIQRVLKPGGYFFATTISSDHMLELNHLVRDFDQTFTIAEKDYSQEFGLQNGMAQLEPHFGEISLHRYPDSLEVFEVDPLVDYVCSGPGNIKDHLHGEKLNTFKTFVKDHFTADGYFHITKDTGLFKCKK